MRSRLLPLALGLVLASAATLPARLAAADEAGPVKPVAAPSLPPTAAPVSPIRAAIAAAEQPRKPVSAALVIAGGITAGIGAGGALAGLLLMATDPSGCAGADCGTPRKDGGRVALFVGAPLLAAGLTMVIIGIQPAPDAAGEPQALARLVPTVALGPTGGSLRWSF